MKFINQKFFSLLTLLVFLAGCSTLEQDLPTALNQNEKISSDEEVLPAELLNFPDACFWLGELQEVDGSEGCNLIIKLKDERILVPLKGEYLEQGIKPNTQVLFGFEEAPETEFECERGPLVEITCFQYVDGLILDQPEQLETDRKNYLNR